jgi:hypothetical protein
MAATTLATKHKATWHEYGLGLFLVVAALEGGIYVLHGMWGRNRYHPAISHLLDRLLLATFLERQTETIELGRYSARCAGVAMGDWIDDPASLSAAPPAH